MVKRAFTFSKTISFLLYARFHAGHFYIKSSTELGGGELSYKVKKKEQLQALQDNEALDSKKILAILENRNVISHQEYLEKMDIVINNNKISQN